MANRSTVMEDLYLVFTGKNPETGHPIIKAHLNPLVWWIWAGAHIMAIGTLLALVPSQKNQTKKSHPPRAPSALMEDVAESRSTVEAGID